MKTTEGASLLNPPCTVQEQTTLSEALVHLNGAYTQLSGSNAGRSSPCLLVMRGDRLQGVLTPEDVVRGLAAGRSLTDTVVGDLITQPAITVQASALNDLSTLLHTLRQHQIQHLPVLEGDRVIGVVTSDRLLHALWAAWQEPSVDPTHLSLPAPPPTALHLLYTLTQALSQAEDFKTALNVTLRQICLFTGWAYGEVWLLGSDRTHLVLGEPAYLAHPGLQAFRDASRTLTFACIDGLPGRVWTSQQPEWIAELDQSSSTRFMRQEVAYACGLRSGIGVPILADHQTVAVLIFLSQDPLSQSPPVLDCVSSVMQQLGQLIQRKQTEEALRISEATNRAIIQAIPDLLIRTNRQGEHLEILSYGNIKGVMWPSHPHVDLDWGCLPRPLVEQRLRTIEAALSTQTIQTYEHSLEIAGELCLEEVRIVPMDDTYALVMVRDVTDARLAEQNFRRSAVIQRALVEAIPDTLIRINRQGECLDVLSGSREDQALFCSTAMSSSGAQLRSQTLYQAFATRQLQRYEQCIEQQGHRRWEEVRIRPLGDDDALVIIRDVTESRQAEAALRQSEARFRRTFEQAAVGICRVSIDGEFLHVNQQFCQILGYTEAELLQLSFQDVTHPEDLEYDLAHIQRLLDDEIQTFVIEKRYLQRDGALIWANLTVSLVRSPTGEPQEFIAVVKDITDHKRAEEALRQSEAMNRAIVKSIPDLLIRVDEEGRHLDMLSGGSLRMVLKPPDGCASYTFFDVLPPELAAQRAEAIQRARETQSLQVYEQEIELAGERCWEEVRVAPLQGAEVLVMIRDVTNRKQAELALRQLNQELETRVEERTAALRVSEERWQLALESHDAGIWDWDLVADVTFRSSRWKEMRGLTENEVGTESREWSDRIHPHDRARVVAALHNYITHKAPSYQEEYRVQHIDGHYIWILDQGRALWNEEGKVIRMVGAEIDISQRKQTEAALRESEDRFRRIFEQSPIGIAITDLEGRITRTNTSLAAILNCSMSGLLHQFLQDLLQITDSNHQLHHLLDQTLSTTAFEQQFLSNRGEECWVTVATSCVFNAFGHPTSLVHLIEDITERKRAEAEAQLLRERLQFVLSASPVMIYACSPSAPYDATFISENILEMLGYAADEWLADPTLWSRLIHPDDAPHVLQKLGPLFAEGRYTSEYRFLDKAGQYHWILDEQRLIRNFKGEPIDIVGYMADISDRKQTELLLQSQQQFLRQLIDAIPHLIFVKDREGHFVLANQALAHFYNTTVNELIGKTSANFNPNPAEIEYFQSADRAVIDLGNPCVVEEVISSPFGYQGYFQTVKVPILSPDGRSRSVLGVATNITLRKQIEDQLRKSEAHLTTAQRIAKLGSWEFNLQTRTIHWSEQTYEIFGRDPAEGDLTYEEFQRYIHPDDLALVEQITQSIIENRQALEVEYRVCRPDGRICYVLSRSGFVMDQSGQPVITSDHGEAQLIIGTVLDITDRRQAEIQLQRINERLTLTNAELDRATRLKDEFLANMSHELRTPLNAILGMTEGLHDEVFGPLGDRQKRPIEMIERSGRHLLALINDILDLSKIEAGKLELQLAPISVKYLCDSSLTFVRQQAIKKGLTLTLEIPPVLPPITVDELRIRQVLINLLSNAVKFTPEGGRITLTVAPETQNGQSLLRFSITDTGIGIDSADLEKLFQSFVQLDSSLNRQQSGTGLGLALVRRLVDLHHGLTEVTSTPGEGSCFTVCLPYTVPSSQQILDKSAVVGIISPDNSRALVIEDSVAASEQITRYLEAIGMEVTVYQQGEGAVHVASQLRPGVIILDILLPNQSGWETLKQLKAHPQTQSIPVIILSVVDERSRGLSLGAVDYLVKPISQEEFRATLQKLMLPSALSPSSVVQALQPANLNPRLRSPLILLAEDNTMNRITISNYLIARGFRLLEAIDGHEAINQAIAHHPDLILMDIQMPDMDGLEAIRLLRADSQTFNTPIIALTALTMPGDRDRCLEAGANDYVAKPIKLKQLTELIERILNPL